MTEEERDEHYRTQDFTGVGCDGSHIPTSMLRDMPNIKKNFHLLYYTTQKSMDFNWTRFFTEVVYGLLAAAILCLITFSTCSGKNIHHLDGYSYDFWMSSFTIYGCLIFMSNVSILCRISQISWFQILWIMIGSIIPFYALSILFDTTLSLENGSQYFLISMSQTYHYYLVLVANITVTFILEVSRRIADTYFRPRLSDYFKYLINHGLEADSRWFTKERMEVYRKDHNPIKKKPRRASFSAEPHPAVVDVNPVGLELKPLEVDGNAQRVSEQNGPTLVRDNELNNGIPRHGVTHTENSLLLRGVSHEEYERPIPDELGQQHATHSRKPSQLGPNKAVSPGVQDTKLESVLASKFSNMHNEAPQLKRAEIQSNEEEIDLNQGGDPKSPQIDFNHSSSRQALIREKKRSSTYSQRLKLDLKEKEQPAFKEDKKTKSPGHTPGKTASQEKLYNLLLMSDTESKDSQPKMELMEPEAQSLPDSSEAEKKPKPTIGKLKLDPKLPVSAFSKNKPPTLLVSGAEMPKQPPKLVLGDRSPPLPPTPKDESRIMSLAPTPLQQIGGSKAEPGFEPAESVYKLDNLEDSRFALDRLRGESAVFIGSVEQTPARIGRRSDDEPNEAKRLKLTKSKQESKIDVNNASFSMDG